MDVLAKIAESGIVPVVIPEKTENAVPTAKAILKSGVRVMEVAFRPAAADFIRAVAAEVPEMTVGTGSVISLAQCRLAVEWGAKFIVSPGYEEETVSWCCENSIPVIPGCATPTEIMMALKHGLKVAEFFPADVYGGLRGLKALSGSFPGMKFIPNGGVCPENMAEYFVAPFVHAVSGSWVCRREDIAAGKFALITALCSAAHEAALRA